MKLDAAMKARQAARRLPGLFPRACVGDALCSSLRVTDVGARAFNTRRVDRGHWAIPENQKRFFEDLAQALNIKQASDWYQVTRKQVAERGGEGVLYHFASLGNALQILYPDQAWDLSQFHRAPSKPPGYWKDKDKGNLSAALKRAQEKLGITQLEDWYWVSLPDLKEVGFPSKFTKPQLVRLLQDEYPEFDWNEHLFVKGRLAGQKRLERAVTSLFPGLEIKSNVRKEVGLVNPDTGSPLELDVYVPSLNLALEYQDIHHYQSADYAYHTLEDYKQRDAKKVRLAADKGISLVLVPCWWDCKEESLMATIKEVRPDLFLGKEIVGQAIPQQIPEGLKTRASKYQVEGVGEPTTACFMTRTSVNPEGWWLFEKYDGVRGFWNPVKGAFYSRYGNKLTLPKAVVSAMPGDLFLDGELWFGREKFHEASKMVRRVNIQDTDWSTFKYMVFDLPNHAGSTYAERYELLVKRFGGVHNSYMEVAPKMICQDMAHLERCYQDIIDQGGEGVILRDPEAPLTPGRSAGYLKHKKYRDAEARIVQPLGESQWECELYAIQASVETFNTILSPNGVTFVATAGTSEFVKRWKPSAGDIVSFKHSGFLLASKKPKHASLYRLRPELSWQDVVSSFKENRPRVAAAMPFRKPKQHSRSRGFWRDKTNWRLFFEDLAKELGFDPLDTVRWSSVTSAQVRKKGGGALLSMHGLKKALKLAFPELSFITVKGKSYWRDPAICRKFFDEFAVKAGFDPGSTENWYNTKMEALQRSKGGRPLQRYNGGFIAALRKAYPELEFRHSWKKESSWKDAKRCRSFFEDFARRTGFDPLDGKSWSNISLSSLYAQQGGYAVANRNGGFIKALKRAFPELLFKASWMRDKGFFKDPMNLKVFFDEFAAKRGFSPSDVASWQAITVRELIATEGGPGVLNYWSLGGALRKAYPNLPWPRAVRSGATGPRAQASGIGPA